jgi:hypothetical protein
VKGERVKARVYRWEEIGTLRVPTPQPPYQTQARVPDLCRVKIVATDQTPHQDGYRVYGLYAMPLLTAMRCGGGGRRLKVYPEGAKGTRLSVFLEAQDDMWKQPSAEFKITLVNQADASKSHSWGQ